MLQEIIILEMLSHSIKYDVPLRKNLNLNLSYYGILVSLVPNLTVHVLEQHYFSNLILKIYYFNKSPA